MVTTEIKARYQNVELNIAYVDWRNVYLLPCQKLIIEVHKGRLCKVVRVKRNEQDDADVVFALFDPIRYKVEDPSGHDLERFRDEYGAKYFRSGRLIKNSYGEDDIRIGFAFYGAIGLFKELPKARDMIEADYEAIHNKSYFL